MGNQDEKLLLDATGVTSLRVSTIIPTILVAIMWVVKIIEVLFHLDFSFLGVKPVSPEGIPGIFLFHFIHGDWEHLFANTIPILVLGSALYYFYRPIANRILLILIFSVGLLTWCGARGGVHIGASGLVYGLTFFLMLSGFIRRDKKLIIISLVVVFLYGSLVWGLYPKYAIENNISWEGHLSGFVMGIVLAIYYKGEVWYGNENGDENGIWDDDDDCDDDIDPETQRPYWDVPEPDKDELTVKYRFRN
ncbi:MAG: rhomboid family intramembrane serine protease [Bacteroidales bacterium]|nr:rhomboid family intramembrane serine protease [Bacteroidales bacterium]